VYFSYGIDLKVSNSVFSIGLRCVRSGGTEDLQRKVLGVSECKGFDCMMRGWGGHLRDLGS